MLYGLGAGGAGGLGVGGAGGLGAGDGIVGAGLAATGPARGGAIGFAPTWGLDAAPGCPLPCAPVDMAAFCAGATGGLAVTGFGAPSGPVGFGLAEPAGRAAPGVGAAPAGLPGPA